MHWLRNSKTLGEIRAACGLLPLEMRTLAFCGAFAVGEYLALKLACFAQMWPAVLVLAVFLALFGFGISLRVWPYAVTLLVGSLFAMETAVRRNALLDAACTLNASQPCEVVFEVKDGPKLRKTKREGIKSFEYEGEAQGFAMRLVADFPADATIPRVGETWRVAGWFLRRDGDDYAKELVLVARGRKSYAVKMANSTSPLPAFLLDMRKRISRRIDSFAPYFPGDRDWTGILKAMLIGERTELAPETRHFFRNAGALHVFAISGLHVMAIARLLLTISTIALVPFRITPFITVPILWLYVQMIGAPPSATRALAMFAIASFASLFWRKTSGVMAWAIAFVFTHAANPLWVMDLGSRYSFAIMLGIVVFMRNCDFLEKSDNRFSWKTRALRLAGFSLAAWSAGVPISVCTFSRLSLIGILSGLVVVPLAVCAVFSGVFTLSLAFLPDFIVSHVAAATGLAVHAMCISAKIASAMPYAVVELKPWGFWECTAWYAFVTFAPMPLWNILSSLRKRWWFKLPTFGGGALKSPRSRSRRGRPGLLRYRVDP